VFFFVPATVLRFAGLDIDDNNVDGADASCGCRRRPLEESVPLLDCSDDSIPPFTVIEEDVSGLWFP
jgi:hypothetical protein